MLHGGNTHTALSYGRGDTPARCARRAAHAQRGSKCKTESDAKQDLARPPACQTKPPVRAPSSSAARGPDGDRRTVAEKVDFLDRMNDASHFEHDQQHYREARATPRQEHPSVVLDSPRVPILYRARSIFNAGVGHSNSRFRGRFRDRRIWLDWSVTEAGGRRRKASPTP